MKMGFSLKIFLGMSIAVTLIVVLVLSLILPYMTDELEMKKGLFKNYASTIADKTKGWTYIEMNITFVDGSNSTNKYVLFLRIDNNYCCYYYDAVLYYNGTPIAEYYYGVGEICEGEKMVVKNEKLFTRFDDTFLHGFNGL